MDIEVVLTQNDPKLGERGQVIKVAPGFAHNFLIPNRKALPATAANVKRFELEKARRSKEHAERLTQAREMSKKIAQTSLTIEVQAGEGDKLCGAVTTHEIQTALGRQGISVEKKDIQLEEPIKKLGAYQVPVKLHPSDESVPLKLWVVKKKS